MYNQKRNDINSIARLSSPSCHYCHTCTIYHQNKELLPQYTFSLNILRHYQPHLLDVTLKISTSTIFHSIFDLKISTKATPLLPHNQRFCNCPQLASTLRQCKWHLSYSNGSLPTSSPLSALPKLTATYLL